ncbi:hypothetical protein RHO12_12765 (plasmid) [Orbus sturtevantii]|uniref:hypothetical protein n=1 Tax=Orbus sturtevantii TaxID=3074109 RepID=UPI00370D6B2C
MALQKKTAQEGITMKINNMETKGPITAWFIGLFSALISNVTNLSLSEWAAFIAITAPLIGLYLKWHYERRADKRGELETQAKIKSYERYNKNNNECDL